VKTHVSRILFAKIIRWVRHLQIRPNNHVTRDELHHQKPEKENPKRGALKLKGEGEDGKKWRNISRKILVRRKVKNDANKTLRGNAIKRRGCDSSISDDDNYCICLKCLQPWSTSKPGQNWVQCINCKRWAHIACAFNDPFYNCVKCESALELYETLICNQDISNVWNQFLIYLAVALHAKMYCLINTYIIPSVFFYKAM
jgi:hypothetical protein